MTERLAKFVLCVALIPVLLAVMALLILVVFMLPIVALIHPDIIKINDKS